MRNRTIFAMTSLVMLIVMLAGSFGCSTPAPTSSPAPAPKTTAAPYTAPAPAPAPAPTTAAAAPSPKPAPTTAASLPNKIVKIGMNVGISGSGALWGYAVLRPGELAVEKINSQGGLKLNDGNYIFQIVTYDHAFEPTKSMENVQRMLLQDKVNVIVLQGGAPTIPALPLASKAGLLSLVSIPSATPLMKPEYPYMYYCMMGTRERATAFYSYVTAQYGIKNVVIINPDDESGRTTYADSKAVSAKYNVEIKGTEYYGRGTTDFYPLLTRVMRLNPDLFELGMAPPADVANFIKQAREMGYKGKIGWLAGIEIDPMTGIAGKTAIEGLISSAGTWAVNDPYLTTEEKALRDEYLARYTPPFPVGAFSFGWKVEILIEAMKKAGTFDKDKIKQVLETQTLKVRGRDIRFGGKSVYGYPRVMYAPLPVQEVKDGKVVTTKVIEISPE